MPTDPVTVTLTYADGAAVSFAGNGAIVYTTGDDQHRLFAVTGLLTLRDVTQLMNELMDSFGEEDIILASSLALVMRRMEDGI